MGLGGTAKKLQRVVDMAEELYERLNYLREQLTELQAGVERTGTQVEHLQREQAVNRALLERLAEQQGIDVDEVLETISNEEVNRTAQQQSQPGQHGQEQRNQGQPGGQRQPGGQGQQGQGQGFSPRSSSDTSSGRDDQPPGN